MYSQAALRKAFVDLKAMTQLTKQKFQEAVQEYEALKT
jgi:hypothetical protein